MDENEKPKNGKVLTDEDRQYAKELGERLLAIRKHLGLTQGEVWVKFGNKGGTVGSQGNISRYESGSAMPGPNVRKNYIFLLGVNADFYDNGNPPMFKPVSKMESDGTPDQFRVAIGTKGRGNMHYISPENLSMFIRNDFALRLKYPLLNGDCWSFPVTTYEMGADIPAGSQVICTKTHANALLPNKPYVFQTQDRLVIRYGKDFDEDEMAYVLTAPHGPKISLPAAEVTRIYQVLRVDRPL